MTTNTKQYQLSGWDLSDLLPEPSEAIVSARLAALEDAVAALEGRRDDLSPDMDPAVFLAIVKQYEELTELLYPPVAYGSLWFSADTQSTEALTYQNRLQQIWTDIENRIMFFSLWWKDLDDEQAERLLPQGEEEGEEYADYRHFLADLRRTKPFTLDEKSEQIINTKNANGIEALITVYSMLTNRLEFTLEVDGETKTLTRDASDELRAGPGPRSARGGLSRTLPSL